MQSFIKKRQRSGKEPGFGREIHKKRPALIISDDSLHPLSHVIIIPASSIVLKTPGIEMVSIGKTEGVVKKSVLLPILVRSIDDIRLVKKVGKLSKEKLKEVEEALKLVLGLD